MTDRNAPPDDGAASAGVAIQGIGAVIPAALIAAILSRQVDPSREPVTVDARALRLVVPPSTIATMLRSIQPNRLIDVTFEPGAILVTLEGLPPLRVEIPSAGLRLTVDEDGIRLGD